MKANLIEHMRSTRGMSAAEAERAYDAVVDSMKDLLAVDDAQVRIPGFGIFKNRLRKERAGRNPRTGEPLVTPAARVIRFSPSKKPRT